MRHEKREIKNIKGGAWSVISHETPYSQSTTYTDADKVLVMMCGDTQVIVPLPLSTPPEMISELMAGISAEILAEFSKPEYKMMLTLEAEGKSAEDIKKEVEKSVDSRDKEVKELKKAV